MLKELLNKRNVAIAAARAIVALAEKEKRTMTADESAQYDGHMAEVDTLGADITRRQRLEATETELQRSLGTIAGRPQPNVDADDGEPMTGRASKAYRSAFKRWMQVGMQEMAPDDMRALQADVNASGGFLYTPLEVANMLISAIKNQVIIRSLATVMEVTDAESLGIPTLATDVSDPVWTTELATGDEDSATAFGRRDLRPQPLAKRIKVSEKLIRKAPNAERIVIDRLGYKMGVAEENGFLLGSGSSQPLGVFTASANGVPASRDVATQNTATAVTFNGLQNAKYSLKAGYLRNAQWIFHRLVVAEIAKIKDTTDQYIWQPAKKDGEFDTLLGLPVNMSEYAPSTMTTGLYVGIVGDFSYYHIVDSLNVSMKRLVELYAEANQIGFICRREVDGAPVLGEAFARVKLA